MTSGAEAARPPRPTLSVRAEGDSLVLHVRNDLDVDLTIWEQRNSWGWPTPEFDVFSGPDGDRMLRLSPGPRRWTRNMPTTTTLRPGSTIDLSLKASDLAPLPKEAQGSLVDEVLWIVGRLHIEPTPEATAEGVWCGTAESDRTPLDPPHRWLPH